MEARGAAAVGPSGRNTNAEDFYRLRCWRRMEGAGSYMGRRWALREVLACLLTVERAVCELANGVDAYGVFLLRNFALGRDLDRPHSPACPTSLKGGGRQFADSARQDMYFDRGGFIELAEEVKWVMRSLGWHG
jgi:hypothetical protein